MEARAKSVQEILHSPDQYLIPFFQRNYSWKRKHWDRLWADLTSLAEFDISDQQHFLGPLVCTPFKHLPGEVPSYQLIDGQQRLTTITILLAAVRDVAAEHGWDELVDEITEDYLIQKWKKGLQRYKVVPRTGDREVLFGIIDRKPSDRAGKSGIHRAYHHFVEKISQWLGNQDASRLRTLFRALTERLSLVVITIEGENPYEIFESLNSTGLPLHESDLIRNYLFMQVPTADQNDFNRDHWSRFENLFPGENEEGASLQTQFFRTYLMRNGTYSKAKSTFVDFKSQNLARGLSPTTQVDELIHFANFDRVLKLTQPADDDRLNRLVTELSALDITTAHPLIMHLLNRFAAGDLGLDQLLTCLQDLASFVIRRSICGESTRAYGRWFCEAITVLGSSPAEELQKYFLRRGWPDDATFQDRLTEFPIYRREPKKCRIILERLERSYGHKEKVDTSVLSIEHVMPQTIDKGQSGRSWQAMLGDSWNHAHERWLHTIGNLTLTGYNSDLSNRPYDEKKQELSRSNLLLNRYFETLDTWNEAAIRRRGRDLAGQIAKQWPRPNGGDYRPATIAHVEGLRLSDRRKLRRDYWAQLLPLAQEHGFVPRQTNRRSAGCVSFPTGNPGFQLLVFVKINDPFVAAAVLFKGAQRRENFDTLRANRRDIEHAIGEKLLWQQRRSGQTLQATARLGNADPSNKSDWPRQHEWLVCTLSNLMDELSKHRSPTQEKPKSTSDSQLKRHRFWQQLLSRAADRTPLHSSISPGHDHWIAKGAGIRGVSYNYVISKTTGRVELVIYRGKGRAAEGRAIFEEFRRHQEDIEGIFGSRLEWDAAEGSQVFRIVGTASRDGYGLPETDWPPVQDLMIEGMIRLEKAAAPLLDQIKQQLGNQ